MTYDFLRNNPGWGLALLVVALSLALLLFRRPHTKHSKLPLPPGPRPIPFLGTLQEFPLRPSRLRELHQKYGDLVYLNAFGMDVIVMGTHEIAIDLLDKRSATYSDRAPTHVAEMIEFEWVMPMIRYNSEWRKSRSAFRRSLGTSASVEPYFGIQHEEVKRHLLRLLESPNDFCDHGRKTIGTTIIRVAYGLDASTGEASKWVHAAEQAMNCFNTAFKPGRYLVQTFPWLRHVPAWLPGAGFQHEFAAWRPIVRAVRDGPWEAAAEKRREGSAQPASMFSTLIERIEEEGEDEMAARGAVASGYLGGADTTLSTLQTFMAAMANNPDVQRRAQAELDAVVGPDRLPTMEDKPSLPYISALVKECLRWRSVVPLPPPHVTTEEDEYKGYRIPKGCVMVSNIWLYSRDPRYYPDPEAFKPERFLEDGQLSDKVMDPRNIAFGYGRRICPGMLFAEASVFTMLSNILHTFSVEAPRDEKGNVIYSDVEMTDGIVSYPQPFDCIITPRSATAEALVRSSCGKVA